MGPHGFGKGSVAVNGERSWNIYESQGSMWGNICLSAAAARSSDVHLFADERSG